MIFQKLFEHPFWLKLTGEEKDFPEERHRAFNAISIFTLIVLIALLPFNIMLGLQDMVLLIGGLTLLQATLYYISRYRKKMAISLNMYAALSYGTLIYTFLFNAGSHGPALYIFFFTLMMLVAFTPRKQHLKWLLLHSFTGIALVLVEYRRPELIINPYITEQHRFTDITSTFVICLLLVLLLTKYLLNSYAREKRKADAVAQALLTKNQQLEAMHREKDRLFSIISHDLKKPLDSIIHYLQMMEQYGLGEEERRALEERLLQLSQHTSELLANLLSWSKAQMEGGHMRLVPVNVQQVIDKEIEQQQLIADKKSIRLITQPNPELKVMADLHLLQLVMRNLVSNAIKFTHPGGEVKIDGYEDNGNGYIKVADNGVGIPPALHAGQFQALRQNVRYGTANEKGTGVGLFLCRQCIELQQGSIWFESEEGKGTTFFVSLPTA